jgi:hypothetical protein
MQRTVLKSIFTSGFPKAPSPLAHMSVIVVSLHSLSVLQLHKIGTFNTSTNPERHILLEIRFCCCSCTGSSSSSQVQGAAASTLRAKPSQFA